MTREEIQSELGRLPTEELRKIRDFLDALLENELEFTDEFETRIRESEEEMKRGERLRVRNA